MIADSDIPGADPSAVIAQYEPYLKKLASRYIKALSRTGAVDMADLLQVGRIAVTDAQRKYNPENGSFLQYLSYVVRAAMRHELGFNNQTGAPPPAMVYLDETISEESETTRGDLVADPDAPRLDETIIDDENRQETAEQIRAALDRMKSDKQRAAVKLVWMEGKSRQAAADEMEMNQSAFYALEKAGRCTLRRDSRLRIFAETMPLFHVSVSRFNTTWTSAVEKSVIWRDEHIFGNWDLTPEQM